MSKHATVRRWLLVALAAIFAGASVLFLACLLFVVSRFSGDAVLPADCAIVFGAASQPVLDSNGHYVASQAGPAMVRRVNKAAALYKAGEVHTLFLTGGRGQGMLVSEASIMREYAEKQGVPASAIVLEEQSRSTEENLRFTRPLMAACTSVVGISDAYHLARIEYLAHWQGWELSTVPAQGRPNAIFETESLFREIAALIMFTVNSILT